MSKPLPLSLLLLLLSLPLKRCHSDYHSTHQTIPCPSFPLPPPPSSSSLSEEEKAHLRGRLLSLVEQSDQQIAVQVAVVFSKVARLDFPKAWPTLFADLLAKLQGPGQLLQRRVYLVLHHILKELASKRLAADQRNFEQVCGLGSGSGH